MRPDGGIWVGSAVVDVSCGKGATAMNNTILANYNAAGGLFGSAGKSSSLTRNGAFLGALLQVHQYQEGAALKERAVPSGRTGLEALAALSSAASRGTKEADAAAPVSLEEMLRAKYPGIHYHVFDASDGNWRTRNDYPHYLLYQDGDKAKETLENWEPKGANPFYGSIDGRFIAPREIHALGSVPPSSKAVVIHPAVQERMAEEPDYAREIYEKIDAWFAFDAARNEAFRPGASAGMSQAVAIGEDGNICNAQASRANGGITTSKGGSDAEYSWWDLRMSRHLELMQMLLKSRMKSLLNKQLYSSNPVTSMMAQSWLVDGLKDGRLQRIFGSEIANISTDAVLAMTRNQLFGTL